jgi:hypothetical protein
MGIVAGVNRQRGAIFMTAVGSRLRGLQWRVALSRHGKPLGLRFLVGHAICGSSSWNRELVASGLAAKTGRAVDAGPTRAWQGGFVAKRGSIGYILQRPLSDRIESHSQR